MFWPVLLPAAHLPPAAQVRLSIVFGLQCTVLLCAVLCGAILCGAILFCAVLCCAVLCCAVARLWSCYAACHTAGMFMLRPAM